jgi:RHS repeat-associated protein
MLTGHNGQVVERYEYDVYGVAYNGKFDHGLAGIGGNPYGFTGKRYEPEMGFYSFAFRDYNPRSMQWMTEDPVKDGLNWYQYCESDPVNWVDLWGLLKRGNIKYRLVKSNIEKGLLDLTKDKEEITKDDIKRAAEIVAEEMTDKELDVILKSKTEEKVATSIKIAERIEKKLDEDPETDIPDPERAKGDQGYTPQPGDKEILDKMKSEFKSEIDKLTGEPKC